DGAMRAAIEVGVSAATDVTGFGLVGHLTQMLDPGQVAAELAYESIPLPEHAWNLASRGIVPGGTQRNLEAADRVTWADDLTPADRLVCVEPPTTRGPFPGVSR